MRQPVKTVKCRLLTCGWRLGVVVTSLGTSTKLPYSVPGPVSTWMGIRAGKPSRYVTATKVISAFYPLRYVNMSISFRAE